MNKSLDQKILRIKNNKYSPSDFIIADAKDGDLAMGITTPGPKRNENGKVRNWRIAKPINDIQETDINNLNNSENHNH